MSDYVGDRSPLRTFGILSLRRRWKFVGKCGALAFIAGLLVAVLKPATYTASTQLLVYVREVQPGPEPVISPGRADLTQLQNEIEIIRSRGMLTKVVKSLKLSEDEEFIRTATPYYLATLFRQSQLTPEDERVRQDLAIDSLEKRLTVDRVGTSHTILVSIATTNAQKSERIANAIGQTAVQARVNAEQEGSRSPLLRERLQGLGPSAYVMTAALAPDKPAGPRKIVIILAATIVGCAIGSLLVLLLDFTNSTIRTAAQVKYLGLECLGPIPVLRHCEPLGATRFSSGQELLRPDPMLDQTLRRASVAIGISKARVVGVASAVAGEGATTIARYLAHTAASSREKVLLVEVNGSYQSNPSTDGNDLKQASAFDICQKLVGLDVIQSSGLDGFDSDAAHWIRRGQRSLDNYDFIVVSLPPFERGPEFRMAAQNLDGILLVLKWGGTKLEKVERAIASSGMAPSEFIGVVLNMVDEQMIGKFGDKLWEAEAALAARRRPVGTLMPAERAIG